MTNIPFKQNDYFVFKCQMCNRLFKCTLKNCSSKDITINCYCNKCNYSEKCDATPLSDKELVAIEL